MFELLGNLEELRAIGFDTDLSPKGLARCDEDTLTAPDDWADICWRMFLHLASERGIGMATHAGASPEALGGLVGTEDAARQSLAWWKEAWEACSEAKHQTNAKVVA